MRLHSFRAVDGVRLGVQTENGVVYVHRAAAESDLKAPDLMTPREPGSPVALDQPRRMVAEAGTAIPECEVSFAPAVPDPGQILSPTAVTDVHPRRSTRPDFRGVYPWNRLLSP